MPSSKLLLLLASLAAGTALAGEAAVPGKTTTPEQRTLQAPTATKPPIIAAATAPLKAPPSAPPELETRAPGSGKPYALWITEPHAFSVSEARARLHFLLDYWTQRFGVKQEWRGGDLVYVTGWVLGIRVEARVHVQGHRIWAAAVDPGPIMRGSAERYIRKKLAKYMHPTFEEI